MLRDKGYFITASGTEVGKTYVTGLLARQAGAMAYKPVASGFDAARLAESDPGRLLAAMGRPVTMEEVEAIAPWRFAAPLSPDMAARAEGRPVDEAALLQWCRERIESHGGVSLIEGVGGVMAPLNERVTVLEWMAALELPAIVVAGSYLGAVSHALTGLRALESAGVPVAMVVANESPQSTVPFAEHLATLRQFIPAPVMALEWGGEPDIWEALSGGRYRATG